MTIFYRGPCVRITHEVFETLSPVYRSYYLDELRQVRVVERSGGTYWRMGQTERELVAVYRGKPVSLYRSTRQPEFDQVRRALARALDRLDDTR